MAYHKISQNSWTTGIHKFLKLAFHKEEDITSDSIQNLVKEIIAYAHGNVPSELVRDDDSCLLPKTADL